jgi:hypothetical protein
MWWLRSAQFVLIRKLSFTNQLVTGKHAYIILEQTLSSTIAFKVITGSTSTIQCLYCLGVCRDQTSVQIYYIIIGVFGGGMIFCFCFLLFCCDGFDWFFFKGSVRPLGAATYIYQDDIKLENVNVVRDIDGDGVDDIDGTNGPNLTAALIQNQNIKKSKNISKGSKDVKQKKQPIKKKDGKDLNKKNNKTQPVKKPDSKDKKPSVFSNLKQKASKLKNKLTPKKLPTKSDARSMIYYHAINNTDSDSE